MCRRNAEDGITKIQNKRYVTDLFTEVFITDLLTEVFPTEMFSTDHHEWIFLLTRSTFWTKNLETRNTIIDRCFIMVHLSSIATIFSLSILFIFGEEKMVPSASSSLNFTHALVPKNVSIQEMHKAVLSCLRNNPIAEQLYYPLSISFPSDAADHYALLLEKTAKYRQYKQHDFGGYKGPWIENVFIDHFISKPLEFFNGLIPLFVQWIDHEIVMKSRNKKEANELYFDLSSLLRPNVPYFLVTQANRGVYKLAKSFPNILMLSSGGFGHIPLPLIKGELAFIPLPSFFRTDIGFYGDEHHGGRDLIFEELRPLTFDFVTKIGKTPHWIEEMYLFYSYLSYVSFPLH